VNTNGAPTGDRRRRRVLATTTVALQRGTHSDEQFAQFLLKDTPNRAAETSAELHETPERLIAANGEARLDTSGGAATLHPHALCSPQRL
jgi:hypothetical protein